MGSNYQDVIAFLVLVLVLVIKPNGLVGEKVVRKYNDFKNFPFHKKLKFIHGLFLVIIALTLLPFVIEESFGRSWLRIFDYTLIYVLLALGLNIVVGFAGLLDLGIHCFFCCWCLFVGNTCFTSI